MPVGPTCILNLQGFCSHLCLVGPTSTVFFLLSELTHARLGFYWIFSTTIDIYSRLYQDLFPFWVYCINGFFHCIFFSRYGLVWFSSDWHVTKVLLNKTNCIQWSHSARMFLDAKQQSDYIDGTTKESAMDNPSYKTWSN